MKTRKVGIKMENPDSFSQRCLDPEDPMCTPDEFFKEISYFIDLNEIYEVKSTCYNNDEFAFIPILLQIKSDVIKKSYDNCKYLLQIWNTAEKSKVYEQPLKNPLKNWAICEQSFLMVYEKEDQDNDCMILMDCYSMSKKYFKGFGIENDITYKEVRFVSLSQYTEERNEVKKEDIRVVKPGCSLHGILINQFSVGDDCLIVAFETPDNQIDFNMLYAYNIESPDFTYKWEQYRIVNPRKNHNAPDRIIKLCNVFYQGFNFAVSLRESGLIDIYWNMARRDSPSGILLNLIVIVKVKDIGMSIGGFYFKLDDGTFQYFKHQGRSNISYSMSQPTTDEEIDFDNIHLKIINQYVKLYTSFKVISKNETFVIVAHGKFLSLYNIEQQKWVNHLYFKNADIFEVLSRLDSTWSSDISIDVMLKNGEWYKDVIQDFERTDPFETASLTLTGKPVRVNHDKQNETNYIIMIQEAYDYLIYQYKNYSLEEQKVNAGDKYHSNRNLIAVQTVGDQADKYFVLQNTYGFMIYKSSSSDSYSCSLKRFKTFKDTYISGNLHSAVTYDIKHHIFLFDERDLYIILMDKDAQQIGIISNIFAISVQFFNKQVSYVLCQDKAENLNSGLRLLDMESTLKKRKCNLILLKNIDFGIQRSLEHSKATGRLCFQKSLSQLIICPILHQNTNKLMGASENDYYILVKRQDDRIITFTQTGQLTTWNLVTGKHICTHMKTEFADQLSGYGVQQYYKNLCSFYSYQAVNTMADEQFYDAWQLATYADKQATYMKRCDHVYKRWKIIEIKSETEVKTIMEFTFPYFNQGTNIFINENKDRLILKIINFRTFIYKILKYPSDTPGSNEVYFELIRQIVDYPDELENTLTAKILTFFSPCFSRYMKIDRRTNQFLIKDAINDTLVRYIPKDILFLSPKGGNITELVNRMKWLDYSTILIINEEGIEKILDIDQDFQEVSYNWRPMFKEILDEHSNIEYKYNPYYYQRQSLEKDDVLRRLKRIYQEYKTDYYLFKKKSFQQFYETMYTTDGENCYYNSHSFTFLHWSIIEQIQKNKLKVKDLEDPVIEQLLYNILPGGNTVLHLLGSKEKQLMRIFQEAHRDDQIRYHMPFLPNILGETPIHRCVEKQDFKSIDTILKYLKLYPSDHHSRGIKDLLGVFVKQQLPGFIDYIDTRFLQTEQIKKFSKGTLKKDISGIITSELWFKEEDFFKQIMDRENMETRIKCEFIDLPGVYHYLDPDFQSFFDQLAITENLDYFNQKSIQKMIDFNYPLVRMFILCFLFVPFCLFHTLFVVYANVIYEHRDQDDDFKRANLAICIVLLVFSSYFLMNEIRQLFREGIEYIISVWNYIDFIAPAGVIFTVILQLLDFSGKDVDETLLRCVFAITTLFMWIKLLYFLRIFKSTGYLIRLIVEVVTDMGIFLLVLLITLTAFGDCLLRLSLSNNPENQFIQHSPPLDANEDGTTPEAKDLFFFSIAYTYRAILGDFDITSIGKVATPLIWIIWTIHMLFNMIVMLNLLISIIGSTFERVVDNQEQAGYQEYACLIAENQHLIPYSFKKSYAIQGKYLVNVTDLESMNNNEDSDPVTSRLDEMKIVIETIQEEIKSQGHLIIKMAKKIDKQVPDEVQEADANEEGED
ncbi:wd-40 repeat protein [Stylonychia lemnae]|uniref:Wd-40 repeat protein n=1 Tax=Stylonychia lemnae TaxID=5949 RepID=A0A077ZM86_STYLE|nr:wd-40 repeat protein [Stylonychia lemnae]|eukprot:CDW71088.1 wd-40 repeat protein [Stylonychia lemnae]